MRTKLHISVIVTLILFLNFVTTAQDLEATPKLAKPTSATLRINVTGDTSPNGICYIEFVAENVIDLFGISFEMLFSPVTYIESATDEPGSWLGDDLVAFSNVDLSTGVVGYGLSRKAGQGGKSGTGVVAKLKVKLKDITAIETQLILQNVAANDPVANPIQLVLVNNKIPGESDIEGNWVEQNSGVNNLLYYVQAVSDKVAWVAGGNQMVLRTFDGGLSWSNVWTSHDVAIFCVAALDANTVLVGASRAGNSSIFRTTNSGASWTKEYEKANVFINYINMFDRNEGIAIGTPADGNWTILKTVDGGNNWQQMSGAPAGENDESVARTAVIWLSNQEGWFGVHNRPKAFHTTNGGASWNEVFCSPLSSVRTIDFNRNQPGVGLAASDYNLARTTDNGASWQEITPPSDGLIYHVVYFQDAFWALTANKIYKSKDNGQNWEFEFETSNTDVLRFVSFVKNHSIETGWAVGDNGTILKYSGLTTNMGFEKEEILIPKQFPLHQNYPNPFNPTTTIRYALNQPATVTLMVYNLNGQRIKQLVTQNQAPGEHDVEWDGTDDSGRNVAGGIYICTIQAGDFQQSRKMILMK